MSRLLLAALALHTSAPAYTASVATVTAAQVRYSYRVGCPVPPSQLRLLRLAYWGFDGRPHQGRLVVNEAVTGQVIAIFRRLYEQRFPIRKMEPIDSYRGSDGASMAADNTSAFNCRYVTAPGPQRWSVHAYGEAIDVNPLENPYLVVGVVLPPAGKAFLDRSDIRPGMAVPSGQLVHAFLAAGWYWGGRWSGSPDYQHFSSTGG